MADRKADVSRRALLRTAAGATGVAAATGTAAASGGGSGGGGGNAEPDYVDWVSQSSNYSKTVDKRGQSEVTIKVGADGNGGGMAFGPPAVWVDPGTKVTWEWTGDGGAHNVVGENTDFSSGPAVAKAGTTFTKTFEESGIVTYYCNPHKSSGMVGGVAVGNVPTVVEKGYESLLTDSAKTLGVASVGAMSSVLALAYVFMKYGGDYGDYGER